MAPGETCRVREHRSTWVVVDYKCNHSAFNGYHETYSEYSCVRCDKCNRAWRTKAAYVEDLMLVDKEAERTVKDENRARMDAAVRAEIASWSR